MRLFCVVTCISFFLVSCYSYQVYPRTHRNFTFGGEKKTAYVVNPGLKKEYQILKEAGLFSLVTDSSAVGITTIKLHPLERSFTACGNPLVASAIVLGQLPVYFPDKYVYSFEEIGKNRTTQKEFTLQIAQRVWFWDMFSFRKKFVKKAARTLAANYAGYNPEEGSTINR